MNNEKIERNEYVSLRVTKEEKIRIEASQDNKTIQLEIIKEIFQSEKNWLQTELSQLDEELIKYRALLITIRQEYRKAQEDHCKQLETFWADLSNGLPSFRTKVSEITKELNPLLDVVKQFDKDFKDISTYRIKDMLELVQKFQGMNTEGMEMFKSLVEKFRVTNG